APALIERCFGESYRRALRLTQEEFLNLGRVKAGDEAELFGLTPLALRMCRSSNGVSRKHGEVSRELWNKMWPGLHVREVPISYVTNGVHAPTWVAPLVRSMYEKYAGENWTEVLHDAGAWANVVNSIPDEEFWRAKRLLKSRLIAFVRDRVSNARLRQGESAESGVGASAIFDPEALTVGFARRVAAYKRWDLILTDLERLYRLMLDAERPVQFVFAGKAHPQDQGAKLILQQLALWKLDPRVAGRAVFLQDYDQEVARQLVQSIDVWLNVPRRPLEASGTSGEKVAMNGGLNLSVLDGWWLEGCDGSNGWAVGGGTINEQVGDEDAHDAESLYRMLETEVVPAYYERDGQGVPRRWVAMMKHAVATLAPAFNSDRMVRDYAQKIYLNE
ncbi:MAG: alpha-glucan family phosphorylase, partial [Pyrinomonadaceae bacterium]